MRWRTKQQRFYGSQAWKELRDSYYHKAHGLCEICLLQGKLVPGEIVHHKIHLNSANINDPNIALNEDNLQLVCRECHERIHSGRRYVVDAEGRVHV